MRWIGLGVVIGFAFGDVAVASNFEIRRQATVYSQPRKDAAELGRIPRGTVVAGSRAEARPGCRYGWIEIEPRGYVCALTETTEERATTASNPVLAPGRALPGPYGRVSKAEDVLVYDSYKDVLEGNGVRAERKMDVRLKKRRRIKGTSYWSTSLGHWIPARHVRRFEESTFAGVALGPNKTLPVAWARPINKGENVEVFAAPASTAAVVGSLPPKSEVGYVGESEDGRFIDIGGGLWIRREETRVARAALKPIDVGQGERWVDVDIDEQTLVVYQDDQPIYATMVSTGIRKRRTPTGTFRIERKYSVSSMYSTAKSSDKYVVADVPWVMYISKVYALHGAYWHDRFGARRSHGCVNLSPRDARAVFERTDPVLPAGWSAAYQSDARPGSLVRMRRGSVRVSER